MWNFKKKKIESLEAQINELQSHNKELTTDRDYWKTLFSMCISSIRFKIFVL